MMKVLNVMMLLAALLFCQGCVLYGDPTSLETMTEENFQLLESDIKIVTATSVMLYKPNEDQKFALEMTASTLTSIVDEGLTDTLIEMLKKEFPNIDPAILNIIELAENRIKIYGGFPIDLALSERHKRLIMAIVNGIHDGLAAIKPEVTRWGFQLDHNGLVRQ